MLLLWTLLAGAGDTTPVPELRLGGGAFTLRFNTGWLGARPLATSPPPSTIDRPFDIGGGVDLSQGRGRLRL